jgi:hypothetical protein
MRPICHDDITTFSFDILIDMLEIDKVTVVDAKEIMRKELGLRKPNHYKWFPGLIINSNAEIPFSTC